MSDKTTDAAETGRTHKAGAFDVRTFIAALIGLYGVILLLTALFDTSEADLAKADGLRVNLWTGLGLLLFAAGFQTWARLKPVRVPDDPADQGDPADTGDPDDAGVGKNGT